MLEALADVNRRIVGTKQVIRAVAEEHVEMVFVAEDADEHIRQKIVAACRTHAVPVQSVPSMHILGTACHIQVGAAAACVVKANIV